jgi:hypothetical protein
LQRYRDITPQSGAVILKVPAHEEPMIGKRMSREHPMPRRFRIAVIAAVVAITGLCGLTLGTQPTRAADLPLVIKHSKAPRVTAPVSKDNAEPRLEEFAKGANASCTAWTDGCRSCGSSASGVFCSTPGIACQSSEPHCTRH